MAEKKTNGTNRVHKGRTTLAYVVLIILSFLCLFFFYVLLVNATRNHFQIQKGFSFVPGKSLVRNLKAVLNDANIPVLSPFIQSNLNSRFFFHGVSFTLARGSGGGSHSVTDGVDTVSRQSRNQD